MARIIVLASLLCLAVPAGAEPVRSLSHDPDTDRWQLTVPGWTATLAVADAEAMRAEIRLQPDDGPEQSAPLDMMGATLPALVDVEEVLICGDRPETAVTIADLIPEGAHGHYVYRRLIFSAADGFLGAVLDTASADARGPLPVAVIAGELAGLCAD